LAERKVSVVFFKATEVLETMAKRMRIDIKQTRGEGNAM
jgi:hypothetical protein